LGLFWDFVLAMAFVVFYLFLVSWLLDWFVRGGVESA
jgi:hypothetical protein